MNRRNTATALAAVKLGIFTIVSVLVTGLLAVIMGNFGFGDQTEYHAVFVSASDLEEGDDVRIAGVSVGEVEQVAIHDRSHAMITFKVAADVPVTDDSGAEVRFLNLVGDRYLALTQGEPGAERLDPDATIPMSRTTPALNLTELFNGFQPLFQALQPDDVNDLAMNIVQVLQGEGGTIQGLLSRTASLTNTIADRDELVGKVIANLSGTLKTVDDRHRQLSELLVQLRGWLGNLAKDRKAIGASLENVGELTREVARLVSDVRPYAKEDIAELRRVVKILNRPQNQAVLDETLERLPTTLRRQARIGTFGSWYNYYLCDFTANIILPKLGDILGLGPVGSALDATIEKLQAQINEYAAVQSKAKRCDA